MDQSPVITSPGPITVNRAPELRRGQTGTSGGFNLREFFGENPWRRFRVTARHIQEGRRGDGASCAIALAWKEAYPEDDVTISGEKPVINGFKVPLAPVIVDWVEKYDNHHDVPEQTIVVWENPATLTGQERA